MQNKLTIGQSFRAGLIAALVAAVINTLVFFIFKAMGIFTETILIDGKVPLTIAPVLMSSIVPTLVATLVFFLFEKFSNKGFRNFRILSIVLLLVSLFSPLSIPNITMAYIVGLDIMHVVVALLLLYFIQKAKVAKTI